MQSGSIVCCAVPRRQALLSSAASLGPKQHLAAQYRAMANNADGTHRRLHTVRTVHLDPPPHRAEQGLWLSRSCVTNGDDHDLLITVSSGVTCNADSQSTYTRLL